jgi:hypothetical protein
MERNAEAMILINPYRLRLPFIAMSPRLER